MLSGDLDYVWWMDEGVLWRWMMLTKEIQGSKVVQKGDPIEMLPGGRVFAVCSDLVSTRRDRVWMFMIGV